MPEQPLYFDAIASMLANDHEAYQQRLVSIEIEGDVATLVVNYSSDLREVFRDTVDYKLHTSGYAIEDWDDPKAPLTEGSPTWEFAVQTHRWINDEDISAHVLGRFETYIGAVLAEHGHPGVRIEVTSPYTVADVMGELRKMKAQHLAALADRY